MPEDFNCQDLGTHIPLYVNTWCHWHLLGRYSSHLLQSVNNFWGCVKCAECVQCSNMRHFYTVPAAEWECHQHTCFTFLLNTWEVEGFRD